MRCNGMTCAVCRRWSSLFNWVRIVVRTHASLIMLLIMPWGQRGRLFRGDLIDIIAPGVPASIKRGAGDQLLVVNFDPTVPATFANEDIDGGDPDRMLIDNVNVGRSNGFRHENGRLVGYRERVDDVRVRDMDGPKGASDLDRRRHAGLELNSLGGLRLSDDERLLRRRSRLRRRRRRLLGPRRRNEAHRNRRKNDPIRPLRAELTVHLTSSRFPAFNQLIPGLG